MVDKAPDSKTTDDPDRAVTAELQTPRWAVKQTRVRAPAGLEFLVTTVDMHSRSRALRNFLTKHKGHLKTERYLTMVQNLTWERLLVRKYETSSKTSALSFHDQAVRDISQGKVPSV